MRLRSKRGPVHVEIQKSCQFLLSKHCLHVESSAKLVGGCREEVVLTKLGLPGEALTARFLEFGFSFLRKFHLNTHGFEVYFPEFSTYGKNVRIT